MRAPSGDVWKEFQEAGGTAGDLGGDGDSDATGLLPRRRSPLGRSPAGYLFSKCSRPSESRRRRASPSWDPVPDPFLQDKMFARGSPKILALSKAAQKKISPKARATTKHGGSPRERASWNLELEKALVDLLHEHNLPQYRGQNGWTSEAWNKIANEFHSKHSYVTLNKNQIQEKEKELKRDYKMLKEARQQSGASWNEKRSMIEGDDFLWNNIVKSFPRAKKFRKKSFPLFEALGELYDGHTAEGTWNFTSNQPPQDPVINIVDEGDRLSNTGVGFEGFQESFFHQAQEQDEDARLQPDEDASVERTEQRMPRRTSATTSVNQEKEPKRMKKDGSALEGVIGRYLDVKTKQAQDEAALLAKEKEATQANDYSIKRCISIMKTMDVTRDEKVKASEVFIILDNREIFISFNEDDPETALLWLRGKMDKL